MDEQSITPSIKKEVGVNRFLTTTDYTMEDVEEACAEIDRSDPVNAVISVFFCTLSPDIKFGSPFVRRGAATVVKALGEEGAYRLAQFAVAFFHKDFFPKASTPQELAKKMAHISSAAFKIIAEQDKKRKIISI